jgi:hypothetical protein
LLKEPTPRLNALVEQVKEFQLERPKLRQKAALNSMNRPKEQIRTIPAQLNPLGGHPKKQASRLAGKWTAQLSGHTLPQSSSHAGSVSNSES